LAIAFSRRSRSLSRAGLFTLTLGFAPLPLLLEVGRGLSGFAFADLGSGSLRRLLPMSSARSPVLAGF
jgi:hypothetical protein